MMPKRTKCRKDAAGNKLCLLKWLEDETVSMLPMKAAKDGQKVYQSVCVDGLCQCVRVHSVSLSVCRWASPVRTCAFCQSVCA